jgi:transposase
MSGQFWLSDEQVERLRPHFPKVRGKPRVDGRQALSGILHVLRNGLRWQDAPAIYGALSDEPGLGRAGVPLPCPA